MSDRTKYMFVALNCLLTFAYQVIYHYQPEVDSLQYVRMAEQFSALEFFDPVTNCTGHSVYALFLALVGNAFAYNSYWIGLVQSLLFGLSSLLLLGELERSLRVELSGLAFLLLLVPDVAFYNGYLLTESLTYSLILLTFCIGLKISNNDPSLRNMFLMSFVIGIIILMRAECIAIIPPILYLTYPSIKSKLASRLAVFVSVPFLLLQFNGIRNYCTFNVYKLGTFNGGEAIYGGNNENLDGSHHPFWSHPRVFIPKDRMEELARISAHPECTLCPERDSFFLKLAIEAWRKDPVKQLGVIPEKLAKNWLLPGNFDPYTTDTTKTRGLQLEHILSKKYYSNAWYAPYKHLFYMVLHWALLSMMIIGMFRSDKRNRFTMAVLMLFATYLLYAIPFCGLPRWHVAIFPLLIIAFTPISLVIRINGLLDRISTVHKRT